MPRKTRFGYDPENTAADGQYIVGKGKPPEHGKFRSGDGRQRGRRAKGTKNLTADFREEFGSTVSVTVGGVTKKVSRQRAILMRLADNATKGQNSAIALALEYHERLVSPSLEREEQQKRSVQSHDFSDLSVAELKVLSFIMSKGEDDVDFVSDIVGVIPIYRRGRYISDEDRKAVEQGLIEYGVEPEQAQLLVERMQRRVPDEDAGDTDA